MNELQNKAEENSSANPNREHKSSVFSMLFSTPAALRELYSAIEGVELSPDIPIDINTLSDALIKGRQNDVSFTIGDRLVVLCEHQSTISYNMPVRMLIYLGDIFKKIVKRKSIYKEKLVKIPTPECIVLYNGKDPYMDYSEQKLSDAFMAVDDLKSKGSTENPLELKVKVYNVNPGHNPEMLKKSETLNNYSIFIEKIREYQNEGKTLAEAVKSAIIYCTEYLFLLYNFWTFSYIYIIILSGGKYGYFRYICPNLNRQRRDFYRPTKKIRY